MLPSAAGRRLAERHLAIGHGSGEEHGAADRAVVDGRSPGHEGVNELPSLLNHVEAPRAGDWTMRSALVRLAQSDPMGVSALLEVIRRLDAALQHASRTLERHPAVCDRALDIDGLAGGEANYPYRDARTTDLARLVTAGLDAELLMDGYDAGISEAETGSRPRPVPLDPVERVAVPLLAVAVGLDGLAERLAAWADAGTGAPVADDHLVDEVGRITASTRSALDALGVPQETGPPPGARSRR